MKLKLSLFGLIKKIFLTFPVLYVLLYLQIRQTQGVSMFPVGLIGDYVLSTPIVKNGKVIDFYDGWVAKRKFPVDMAGFAVNVKLLMKHEDAKFPFIVGYEEDVLLKKLGLELHQIEPKAENCSKVMNGLIYVIFMVM